MTSPTARRRGPEIAPPSPPARGAAPASRADGALSAIDEMLERLESVTRAGQRHLMHKILTVLATHPMATSAGVVVATYVEDLRREAAKVAPDGGTFARAARRLIATLLSS